jgi:hypothetical protein
VYVAFQMSCLTNRLSVPALHTSILLTVPDF